MLFLSYFWKQPLFPQEPWLFQWKSVFGSQDLLNRGALERERECEVSQGSPVLIQHHRISLLSVFVIVASVTLHVFTILISPPPVTPLSPLPFGIFLTLPGLWTPTAGCCPSVGDLLILRTHCPTPLHECPLYPAVVLTLSPWQSSPAIGSCLSHPGWSQTPHIGCPHAWAPSSPNVGSDTPFLTAVLQGHLSQL